MSITVLIGDVATIQRYSIDPRNHPETSFDLYSILGFDNNRKPQRLTGSEIGSRKIVLPRQGVLFSRINPRINRVWTFSGSSLVKRISSTEFVCLVPDEGRLELEYLGWRLRVHQIVNELPAAAAAATKSRQRIQPKALLHLPICLPSLREQRRIVTILNRADKIESLRSRATERQAEFAAALFSKVFGNPKQIAARFPIRLLREVSDIRSGVTKGRKIDPKNSVRVPYLRVANVQDGFLNLAEVKTIEIRRGEEHKYALTPGDLVMTEGGGLDTLGRAAIWNGELDYCSHQNHVFRVRPNRELVLTDYLRDVAGSEYGKAYFLSVAKGTTIANINKTQLGDFPVPIPPLELQSRYGHLVAKARHISARSETATNRSRMLSRSLMAALLK